MLKVSIRALALLLHAAAGAQEERGTQPVLEIADMAADGGMGDEELGGSLGETLEPGSGLDPIIDTTAMAIPYKPAQS